MKKKLFLPSFVLVFFVFLYFCTLKKLLLERMEDNTKYIVNLASRKLLTSSLLSTVVSVVEKLLFPFLITLYAGAEGFVLYSFTSFMPILASIISDSLGVSVSVLYSRCLGEGNREGGRHIVNQINTLVVASSFLLITLGLLTTFFISSDVFNLEQEKFAKAILFIRLNYVVIFLTIVFDYLTYLLRCTSNPKLASVLVVIKNFLNCFFLALFLIVFDMDYVAPVLSLAVAYFVVSSVSFIHFYKYEDQLDIQFERPKLNTVKEIWQFASKIVAEKSIQSFFEVFINITIVVFFKIEIVAIVFLQKSLMYIFYTVQKSITYSMMPLYSVYYGERNKKAVKYISQKFIKISFLVGCCITCIVLIFKNYIVVNIFNFEYSEVIDDAIYAVCIMALYFPIRFVNTTVSNILTCVKQNTLAVVTVMTELLTFPSLFFVLAIVLNNEKVLWWSFLLSEIVTVFMYVVISFFYRKIKKIKSWLFYPDFISEYKNNFYILLKTEKLKDLELYQEMTAMFLDYNEVSEEDKIRTVQIIGEIVEFAIGTEQEQSQYVDIQVHVTNNNEVCISAKMDNKFVPIVSLYAKAEYDMQIANIDSEDAKSINMFMLRALSKDVVYERVLSLSTLNIKV